MMNDVITIGDAMITMNPVTTGPMRFVHTFERKVGGAELNFAIGCARLGLQTGFISRLGHDEFGKYLRHFIRGEGIDVSQLQLVEGYPTSLNFKEIMENGSGRTFYYRNLSPTSTLSVEDLDETFFQKARWLHISGVFPAVDAQNIEIVEKGIELAKTYGLTISLDPNIRLKLWSREKARETLMKWLPDVDVLLTGEEEARMLLKTERLEEMIETFHEIGISQIAIKKGSEGSVGYRDGNGVSVPAEDPGNVVDTVGAGDGFDAGFVYGALQGWSLERTLTFANTVGSMVVGVSGDNEGLPDAQEVRMRMGELERVER